VSTSYLHTLHCFDILIADKILQIVLSLDPRRYSLFSTPNHQFQHAECLEHIFRLSLTKVQCHSVYDASPNHSLNSAFISQCFNLTELRVSHSDNTCFNLTGGGACLQDTLLICFEFLGSSSIQTVSLFRLLVQLPCSSHNP
jgi:hypothetical protein